MPKPSFCFITPSYAPDFERCKLLVKSINLFSAYPVNHYIIVKKKDLKLFKKLESSHTIILTVESILPWWIKKIPLVPNGWFSFKTLPIRNWLLQQIVKLEAVNHVKEDVLIFLDSDICFVRPFNCQDLVRENKVKLFREPVPTANWGAELPTPWFETAHSLLGLEPFLGHDDQNPIINYISGYIVWKKEHVLQLHQHIEKTHNVSSWIEAVTRYWSLSEYTLYGVFVDSVLKEKSNHYWDSYQETYAYWGTERLDQQQLADFFQSTPTESFVVMISAKSNTPAAEYEQYLDKMYQISLETQEA